MRGRRVGFALANAAALATSFPGFFPSPSFPNFPCRSPTGQAHSIENSFLLLSPGVVFHCRWRFQSEKREGHAKD